MVYTILYFWYDLLEKYKSSDSFYRADADVYHSIKQLLKSIEIIHDDEFVYIDVELSKF